MVRVFPRTILALALLVAIAAPPSDATTLIQRTAANQVDLADLVFVGTVVDHEAVPTGDSAFAFTYVTFEVEDVLKGSTEGQLLTLQLAGGQVGPDIFEVKGLPTFTIGQRHLLFVAGNGELGCPLVGWGQGKLDFIAHPLSGEMILVDYAGRAVTGLENGRWQQSALALTRDGMLRGQTEAGVEILSEDGVEITLDRATDDSKATEEEPAPASRVLSALRGEIQARSAEPTFRTAPATRSASPSEVPAIFQFQAHPGTTR